MRANGSGDDAEGGDIVVEAARNISITSSGKLEANGTPGPSEEDATPAESGNISLKSTGFGTITIEAGALVRAQGRDVEGINSVNGVIKIGPACDIVVNGVVDTKGPEPGVNVVTYRNSFSFGGSSARLLAPEDEEDSGNFIECRSNGAGGCVTAPSGLSCSMGICTAGSGDKVKPDAILSPVTLPSCTFGCGNSVQDPGEECDDGNTAACDGCSPTCKIQIDNSPCGTAVCMTGGTCDCATANCTPPGTCVGSTPVTCDDGNQCTTDGPCDPSNGCSHAPVNCDDNDPDTIDRCTNVVTGCTHSVALDPALLAALTSAATLLLDVCAGTDPVACAVNAYTCRSLTAAVRPIVSISKLQAPDGDERLKVSGRATFPPLEPPLNPMANGLRLIVSDATGPLFDFTLPSGALTSGRGWLASPAVNPTKWKYKDGTGSPIGGIVKADVKLTGGLVTFNLQGKGNYGFTPALPLTAMVVLNPKIESTNQCTQLTFPGPDHSCGLYGSGTLKCR